MNPQPPFNMLPESVLWEAVVQRTALPDRDFVYAVKTTGVFCRPGCAARTPNRKNVRFFANAPEAVQAGFRACLRCHPTESKHPKLDPRIIAACRFIEAAEQRPSLNEVAEFVGLSPSHFQKSFKARLGVSPSEYTQLSRLKRFARLLQTSSDLTSAIYASGYQSSSRGYADASQGLGMTPGRYRHGGSGEFIEYGTTSCSLGRLLVAMTARGVCRIDLGASQRQLVASLRQTFPRATAIDRDDDLSSIIQAVGEIVDGGTPHANLPLDIRGTAFQCEVWQALRKLPSGQVVTYRTLAESLGRPRATRAVASACGANQLAVLIPCHRVVRTDGKLGGYRWGLKRKAAILARERQERDEGLR